MTKQQRKITNLQREISNNTINDVKQISLSHVITDKIFKLVENQVQHCQKSYTKRCIYYIIGILVQDVVNGLEFSVKGTEYSNATY